jgi:hypothetical protein
MLNYTARSRLSNGVETSKKKKKEHRTGKPPVDRIDEVSRREILSRRSILVRRDRKSCVRRMTEPGARRRLN